MTKTSLSEVERRVALISSETAAADVAEVIHQVDFVQQQARAIKLLLEQQLIEWIDENGDLTIGTVRYYVGTFRTYKARSLVDVADAVLTASGGVLETFCQFLSTNAFKPGSVRGGIGDQRFGELFDVKERPDLKTGKPKRGVHKVDDRYLPARPAR